MKIKQQSQKKLANSARFQALMLIYQIEFENEYSNVLIDRFLQQSRLSERDKRLVVQLVYGVIQRRLSLNYYLEPLIENKKIDHWIESLLRMSIYQLIYLDRIPEHAIVSEAVTIAKVNGHDGLGKFVNAILRQFIRTPLRSLPNRQMDFLQCLSIEYSMPLWLVEELYQWLSDDAIQLENLLASLLENPYLSVRITKSPKEREVIQDALLEEGIETQDSVISPYGLRVKKGNVIESNVFKEGLVTVQDESSMLVVPLGKLKGQENVLDACAAPGGKATHIAQLLTTGHLTALDLSKNKLEKVNQHLKRMNLQEKVLTIVADASKFFPKNNQLYDTIYLDAPCSGLGLMRRKPEIKYEKTSADLIALSDIQLNLLKHVSTLLKPGGILVYSTCTLTPIENEQVVEKFLKDHAMFKHFPIAEDELLSTEIINKNGQVRIWPHQFHTDGFFIARLIKEEIE